MAEDEDIILTCPCCLSTLKVDDAGELELVAQLSEAERRGVRGIVVEEATPNWQLQNYHFNSQREKVKYRPEQLGTLPCIPEAIEQDAAPVSEQELTDAAAVLTANTNDLKSRNLN